MMSELFKIFITFFKIGTFTFGGGYAMVLLIQREVVERNKWLTMDEFMPALALAQSAPGPMVVNTAIMIGYRLRKTKGGLIAAFGAILPSFVIMLLIALLFSNIANDPTVESIFKGMRPAVVSLILTSVIVFAKKVKYWTYPIAIAVAMAIYKGFSPLLLILMGVIAGVVYAYINRKRFTR